MLRLNVYKMSSPMMQADITLLSTDYKKKKKIGKGGGFVGRIHTGT